MRLSPPRKRARATAKEIGEEEFEESAELTRFRTEINIFEGFMRADEEQCALNDVGTDATALLEEVEEIVRGWGGGRRERLHLRVREDNVAAREMYVRNGYEEIIDGADGSAPSSRRGEGRGILLMGKEL